MALGMAWYCGSEQLGQISFTAARESSLVDLTVKCTQIARVDQRALLRSVT